MLVDRQLHDAGREVILLRDSIYDLPELWTGALIATGAAVRVVTRPAEELPR